jgi:hypothetical protein
MATESAAEAVLAQPFGFYALIGHFKTESSSRLPSRDLASNFSTSSNLAAPGISYPVARWSKPGRYPSLQDRA